MNEKKNDSTNKRIIRSFGRNHARGLSSSQKDILQNFNTSKYSIIDSNETTNPMLFFGDIQNVDKIFVEIGFGAGEHLIENAIRNSNVGFIGCEPFENGVVKVLQKINSDKIENVRVYKGDARYLLKCFENNSVDRFYILFPDPWPKKKHHKRRLLSKEFFSDIIYPRLKNKGDIVIATDNEDYMLSIIDSAKDIKGFSLSDTELTLLTNRPSDFIATRYEQKAISQGKNPFYLLIKKSS